MYVHLKFKFHIFLQKGQWLESERSFRRRRFL